MGRASYGGSTGIVDHPANWNEEAVGGGRRGSEAERYSGLGAAAAQRQAYQADFSKAQGDEQRGLDMRNAQDNGLRNMRQAAMGNAPSQAAILGNAAAGQSLQAQLGASSGARGMGQAAAQMQAQNAMGGQQLGAVGQYTGMRGNEMAHAQAAYGAGANQMRSGDYAQQAMAQQQAEAQARAEQTQRELNQAAQMGYEQMGVRGNQAQSEGELRQKGIASKEANTRDSAHDQESNRFANYAKGAVKTVGSWFGLSDERSKQDVKPLGMGGAAAKKKTIMDQIREELHHSYDQPDSRDVSTIRGMDPDAKDRRDLHRAMEEGGAGAHPYAVEREPAKLTPGHPAGGYFNERRGQVGDVTGGGPQASYDLGFGAGPSGQEPSTDVAPGTSDFEKYGEPVDRKVMLSDDHTKLAKAWREGVNHATEAANTGTFGKVPDYVAKSDDRGPNFHDPEQVRKSSVVKRQPLGEAGNEHGKASGSYARQDAGKQRRYNDAVQADRDKAMTAASVPSAGDPFTMGSKLAGADRLSQLDADNESRKPRTFTPYTPSMTDKAMSYADAAPDAMADTLGRAYELSDRRSKTEEHAEGEMGRQLAEGFKPFEYEYKPGFAEQEGQQRGEKNVGPMAQNMASNPVTGSAVKKRPDGLLVVDIPKTTKINSAGIGYLAAKMQKQDAEIARLKGGR